MGTFYRDSLVRQGYDEAAVIHEAWQNGNRERALASVSDDLLSDLCAAGDPRLHASDSSASRDSRESMRSPSASRGCRRIGDRSDDGALAPTGG